jgi:spermidine synthase
VSFLLKIKSYFIDTLLEERNTPQNPVLRLYLSNGQLKLCTQNAVYSYGNYYYNFRDSFTMLDISNRNIRKVLVLGLGTGSIIQLLEKKYKLRADFDAVESDPEIVDMFHKYKNLITPSDIKIFTQDAFQFIQTHVTRYDLICMDIFADNLVPEMFESTEFLMNLKR